MPLWILFFTALTLALHSVPAEAPEPEPSAPVEVVLTEPVFRRKPGLPLYPDTRWTRIFWSGRRNMRPRPVRRW